LKPAPPILALPPPVAESKFQLDPRVARAADDVVREVVVDRLRSETRTELVDAALRVRRELLRKLNGELRYLEQRARREARERASWASGISAASAEARRRRGSGTVETRKRFQFF
jgi:hypothetical protein